MPRGRTDFGSMFDRMQTWHRHRYRKTARTISDQAMESYLREDVPCGFPLCNMCSPTLPHLPRAASHLVIPDCTILETYLEVFQLPELQGVIYFTSVVKQVGSVTANCFLMCRTLSLGKPLQVAARGNLRKGNKIRELYQDARRQCVLFDDTHCVWTAGEPREFSR